MEQTYYQRVLLAVIWTFTSVATLVVSLRLLTRVKVRNVAGFDDLIISFSLALVLANAGLYSYASSKGIGRHAWTLSQEQRVEATKWYFISAIILDQIYAWPKLSVAILLHRVFIPRRWVLALFYFSAITLIIYTIILSPFEITRCKPVEGVWNPEIPAKCWDKTVFTNVCIFTGPYSAVIDFTFALYPARVLWGLQTSKSRKIGLSILMGLGIFAGAIAIAKTVQLPRLNDTDDATYGVGIISVWSFVEACVVIIAASVPTLGPLAQTTMEYVNESVKRRSGPGAFQFRNISSGHDSQSVPLESHQKATNNEDFSNDAPKTIERNHALKNGDHQVSSNSGDTLKSPDDPNGIMKRTDILVAEESPYSRSRPPRRNDSQLNRANTMSTSWKINGFF